MKLPISLVLFLLFTSNSIAQIKVSKGQRDINSFATPDNGIECISMLKKGTLIVRLSSFSDKINHIEETKGKESAEIEKEIIETANKSIIREFKDDYRFSDVVFTYGKELDQYLKNRAENIFLNDNLEFDPTIKIKDGPVFILATKSTSVFKLCDSNFIPIIEPSIEYVSHYLDSNDRGLNAFAQGFRQLVRSKSIKKLNNKLNRYARF